MRHVRHVNAVTGRVRWKTTGPVIGDQPQGLSGPVVVSGRTAFVRSFHGRVYGYDLDFGAVVRSGIAEPRPVGPQRAGCALEQQWTGPAVGGGVLAVSHGNTLTVFG